MRRILSARIKKIRLTPRIMTQCLDAEHEISRMSQYRARQILPSMVISSSLARLSCRVYPQTVTDSGRSHRQSTDAIAGHTDRTRHGLQVYPSCFLLDARRGRDAGYPTPPAQIPACGFPAPGSSVILASALPVTREIAILLMEVGL